MYSAGTVLLVLFCLKIGTHEGTSPCDLLSPCNWSCEVFTHYDWSQRLVPRTVHMKLFEELIAGTCPRNSNWIGFVGLVAGTKAPKFCPCD